MHYIIHFTIMYVLNHLDHMLHFHLLVHLHTIADLHYMLLYFIMLYSSMWDVLVFMCIENLSLFIVYIDSFHYSTMVLKSLYIVYVRYMYYYTVDSVVVVLLNHM